MHNRDMYRLTFCEVIKILENMTLLGFLGNLVWDPEKDLDTNFT